MDYNGKAALASFMLSKEKKQPMSKKKKTNKTTVDGVKSEIFYWFRKRGDLTRNIAFPLCLSARKPLSKSGFLRPFSPLILGMYGL